MKEFDRIVGSSVAFHRKRTGYRQDEVAQFAQRVGFSWTQGTVAAIETGRRTITWMESGFLQALLKVGQADLLQSPQGEIAAGFTKADLARMRRSSRNDPPGAWTKRLASTDLPLKQRLGKRDLAIVVRYGLDPDGPLLQNVWLSSSGVAEKRLAENLGCSSLEVAAASFALWGKSLSSQRDHIYKKKNSSANAGTTKGHITRALAQDVADLIDEKSR